jgi:hypothetical protein
VNRLQRAEGEELSRASLSKYGIKVYLWNMCVAVVIVPYVVRMLQQQQQQEGETGLLQLSVWFGGEKCRPQPPNAPRLRTRRLSCLPPRSVFPLSTTLQLHSGLPNLVLRLTAPPVVELSSLPTK